jgi:putative hydrolase of the HAD superfamily
VSATVSGAPRIVYFDVGDTLLRADPSWAAVYAGALAEHGIQVDPGALAAALVAQPWSTTRQFEATEAAAYEAIKAFDQSVLARLGHRDLPDAVFRSLDEAFLRPESWLVFPDVVPAIGALRDAGIRTGIISNWTWRAPELLDGLGLGSLFDVVTISARVGWQKPEPAVFRHALDAAGVEPSDAVHVGDSFETDAVGARSVGIRPVLIERSIGDPARRPQAVPAGDDVPVIQDLNGLLDLMGLDRPHHAGR